MRALAFRLRPRIRFPRIGVAPQIVAVGLILVMVGAMAIVPTRQLIEQQRRIEAMGSDLSQIERSNSRLEARIERLKNPDFIEQRAREQMGLVRPGETSYLVLPPSRSARDTSKKADVLPPAPREPGFIEGVLGFIGF